MCWSKTIGFASTVPGRPPKGQVTRLSSRALHSPWGNFALSIWDRSRRELLWASVATLLAFAAPAHGQGKTLGYVLGQVFSSSGPVGDATITAWHVDTARTRTAVSGADGRYRFSGLAVGRYAVTGVVGNWQTSTIIAEVNVGEGTVVDLRVESPRAVDEVVVVRESISPVDVTRSETTRVVTAGDIERLPILRDPNAVVLMAPGAVYGDTAFGTGRRDQQYGTGFGYASLGGASVAENVYYINGMNVTNFRNGLGASTVPFEFYDQFQLKTGGFGAEFGRATGGVINSVTKRGTNVWDFTIGGYYEPASLRGHVPNVEHPSSWRKYDSVAGFDEKDELDLFVSVGGPAVPDRLLVYGIYDFRSVDERSHSAWGRRYEDVDDDGFWGLKLDWLLSDNHRIEYTGFSDDRTVKRTSYAWDESTGEVGEELRETDFRRGGVNHIVAYRGYFGTRVAASVLWGTGEYDLTNASPGDADCPLAIDSRSRGSRSLGCWTSFIATGATDEREVARADFEWAVGEQHLLSFGLDREVKTSFDLVEFSGGEFFRYIDVIPGTVLRNGGVVPEGVTEATLYSRFESGGHFDVIASAYYIEDEWLIAPINATLRLGLRNERFDNRNAEGRTFLRMTDQYAPRIGFAWDARGDGRSKLIANYGRYHLPVASIANIRMASSTTYTEEWFVLDGPIAEDGSAPLRTPIGQRTVFADGSTRDVRTLVDQDLEPMAQDEYILGYEWQVLSDYVASVTFTYRDLVQGIEDVTLDEALGSRRGFSFRPTYVLANPGRDIRTLYDLDGDGALDEITLSAEDLRYPSAKRRYKALTLDLKRPWEGEFYIRGAYTLSHSYGNYEGTVRSDTGEDIAGFTTQFDAAGLLDGADGDLPNDRRHMVRIWSVWEFADNWQVSTAFEYSSGRPRNAFGYHPTDLHASRRGPVSFFQQGTPAPRGSLGTTSDIRRLDVGLKYTRDAFADGELTLRLDIFNVFDFDSEVEVDERADGYWGRQPSPTFGLPVRFQQPRVVRIGLQYGF